MKKFSTFENNFEAGIKQFGSVVAIKNLRLVVRPGAVILYKVSSQLKIYMCKLQTSN